MQAGDGSSEASDEALADAKDQSDGTQQESSSTSPEGHPCTSVAKSTQRVIKRRNRKCLSCTRCHRMKVKCDQLQPACTRCSRTGYAKTCIYTHKAENAALPRNQRSPFILAGEDPQAVVATWFFRKRGSSHWRSLMNRLECLSGLQAPPFAMAVREHMEGDCSSDLTLPGNFPFGSQESHKYTSLDTIYALAQSCTQDERQTYIDNYLRLYQPMYPVLEAAIFKGEVEKYVNNPNEVDICWLALFLVVLGLGAYATNRDTNSAAEFFLASEACLARTPYMFRPTLMNIKTLCLMVIAKQVANATCWALDSCWSVMGMIVRLAVMIALHQNHSQNPVLQDHENVTSKRLWIIIVYLDIQLSLITGQPSLLPREAVLVPYSSKSSLLPASDLCHCWTTVLPEAFPVICHFLHRVNSTCDEMSYNEVLQYDAEIRTLMRQLTCTEGGEIHRMTVDIFFRRVLMCLHRRHALHDGAPTVYPVSYWSSLECSLALLVHHRELSEHPNAPQDFHLVGRPFMLDFFAAALTAGIHLTRSDAPLAATSTPNGRIPPRQTILDTLRSCMEIISREKYKSICFRAGYRLLTAVIGLIPEASDTEMVTPVTDELPNWVS